MPYTSTYPWQIGGTYKSALQTESMDLFEGDAARKLYQFMHTSVLRYRIHIDLLFLKDFVCLEGLDEIQDYLFRHPDMIEPVLSLSKRAAEVFGQSTQLLLEYSQDPELDFDSLALTIRQRNYPADFFDQIDNLLKSHAQLLSYKSGWITVTTDFNPPQF